MAQVKRRYDASRRQERAERTRQALVDAAHAMLLADGYVGTSLARVAHSEGVSVESVYKRFGGKPGLVRAVVTKALAGAGTIPAENRSDALPASDPEQLLGGWGRLAAEVSPRVAPLLLLVRAAAAHDPALAELAAEFDAQRRTRMRANARRLARAGQLRPGVPVEQATDVLWTFSSPELYDLLVVRCDWPLERYGTFVTDGLRAQLLSPH